MGYKNRWSKPLKAQSQRYLDKNRKQKICGRRCDQAFPLPGVISGVLANHAVRCMHEQATVHSTAKIESVAVACHRKMSYVTGGFGSAKRVSRNCIGKKFRQERRYRRKISKLVQRRYGNETCSFKVSYLELLT